MLLTAAAAAVAFAPGMLRALSPAAPASTSIAAPTWRIGDRWTYNVSMGSMDERVVLPQEMLAPTTVPTEAEVRGTLTVAVTGAASTESGAAWNVSEDATVWFGAPRPILGMQPLVQPMAMAPAHVSGFAWIRQSDLAVIYTLRTVQLNASWTCGGLPYVPLVQGADPNATYALVFGATVQIWYHPALALWQFPLQENATWRVASNETVLYTSSFEISGPNVTVRSSHEVKVTVPVDFTMRTGFFESVTTPAGMFRSLPATAFRGPEVPPIQDRDASAVMNLTSDADVAMPRVFASAWFSGQVGNVVKANLSEGMVGPRLELDLVSYSYS